MSRKAIRFLVLGLLLMLGCQYQPEQVPFERNGWLEKVDGIIYPNRERMLNDLLTRHKLIGLTTQELRNLLGPYDTWHSEQPDLVCYTIDTYMGTIDPVYIKTLLFAISHDSVVVDARIHVWEKDEAEKEYRPKTLMSTAN